MAVNALFNFNGYNSSTSALLSEETRRKLISLGIDPSTVSSESQAKIIIENAQQTQRIQKNKAENIENCPIHGCSSELDLIQKARELAKKMHIILDDCMSLDEILTKISNAISEVLNSEKTDKAKFAQYEIFNNELAAIKSSYAVTRRNEDAVIMSMNLNANINKYILGLE